MWFPPGKRNVIVYHQPECKGCGLETCIEMDKKCIRSITVDELERAVDQVLQQSAHEFADFRQSQRLLIWSLHSERCYVAEDKIWRLASCSRF